MKRRLALCLLAAATTLAHPAAAFRTAGDTAKYSQKEPVRWRSPVIPLTVVPSLGPVDVALPEAVDRALTEWTRVDCANVAVELSTENGPILLDADSRSTISWINADWESRGFDPALPAFTEVTYLLGDDGFQLSQADIYLNGRHEVWSQGTIVEQVQALQSVLLHELGHALGLLHPCEDGSTDGAPACAEKPEPPVPAMFPYLDARSQGLTEDDRAGLCFLYPATPSGPSAPGGVTGTAGTGGTAEKPPGDSCVGHSECNSGACLNGTCRAPCTSDTDCGAGQCVSAGSTKACSGGSAFGEPCTSGNDCASALCVADVSPAPFCTKGCTTNTQCPPNYECASAEGTQVCAPTPAAPEPGCGCQSGGAELALSPLAALAMIHRVLRRRPRRTAQQRGKETP